MRLALGVLLGAAGAFAMSRRLPSGHRPPQPEDRADQSRRAAADGHHEADWRQPDRAGEVERQAENRATEQKRPESEERHRRREYVYWWVTGSAAVSATVGTLAAAVFAAGAYNAAVQSVAETRRQADTAQEQLVASTRARLKITSIKDVRVGPLDAGGLSVTLLSVVAAYKNFGQSPAQNIFLSMRIFVIGTGPSPRETCEREKAEVGDHSFEIVFPQDEEGSKMYGAPVLPDELEAQAVEARVTRPGVPVELAMVGCLTYKSTNSSVVYVTGIYGELRLAKAEPADGRGRRSTYKAIVEGGETASVGLELQPLSAWAD